MSDKSQKYSSPFQVALVEPEIPPNTGNIARLCAATFTPLHLVGKLGFRTDDKAVRRAGLDYWSEVEIHHHLSIEALYDALAGCRFLYFTTKAERAYIDFDYAEGDCLWKRDLRSARSVAARELGKVFDDSDAKPSRALIESRDVRGHRPL